MQWCSGPIYTCSCSGVVGLYIHAHASLVCVQPCSGVVGLYIHAHASLVCVQPCSGVVACMLKLTECCIISRPLSSSRADTRTVTTNVVTMAAVVIGYRAVQRFIGQVHMSIIR